MMNIERISIRIAIRILILIRIAIRIDIRPTFKLDLRSYLNVSSNELQAITCVRTNMRNRLQQ